MCSLRLSPSSEVSTPSSEVLSIDPHKDFPVAQTVKNLPAMQETSVQSLGWEDPLEKEMATHSSILAWKIPWTDLVGYSSVDSQELVVT